MKRIVFFWIVLFLIVSTGIGEAIGNSNLKKDKDSSFEDKNRELIGIEIHSPIEGFEYDFSEILINISAWSDNGECFSHECESYEGDECLEDPEGFGNCFFDNEGDCDTYECWDIVEYNECISEDCFWNETNGNCNYNPSEVTCLNIQNESDCSIPNQYDLACYWDNEECDDLECDFFVNETNCEEDSYDLGCNWEAEEINIWYSLNNFEENTSYYEEVDYWFEDGDHLLVACTTLGCLNLDMDECWAGSEDCFWYGDSETGYCNYNVYSTSCDISEFSVNTSFEDINNPNITIISPVNGIEIGPVNDVFINISTFDDIAVDRIWLNTTNGVIDYEGPDYFNLSEIGVSQYEPWPYNPNYISPYIFQAWVNDTSGNVDYDYVEFYNDITPPNITIISPQNGEEYNYSQILINLSAWDNFGVDSINYTLISCCEEGYIQLLQNQTYIEPIYVNLPNGRYNLSATTSDIFGISFTTDSSFRVNSSGPELIFNSPQNGEEYYSSQILINLSVYSNNELDTIWLMNNTEEVYTEPFYQHFSEFSYNYFSDDIGGWRYSLDVCANDTVGNIGCQTTVFNVLLPDLTVTDLEFSFTNETSNYNPYAGDTIEIGVTVKNIGNLSVSNFNYNYNFDYEDMNSSRESFGGRDLDYGEEITLSFVHEYDNAENYTFYFELDPDNEIDEFNESNNIGLENYFINGIPDLAPTLISFEQNNENPYLVTFNFEITNYGTIWTDVFYYNIDYGEGEGSGGYSSEEIQPGESYPFTLTYEYPSLGEYELSFDIYLPEMEDMCFQSIQCQGDLNESNNFLNEIINLVDPSENCLKGDINGDEIINILDIIDLVNIVLGETVPNDLQTCAADYDSDGSINVLDVVMIVDIILG